ncbi:MAG: AI-2E family transporter, partial [Limisphaerales bacterium]
MWVTNSIPKLKSSATSTKALVGIWAVLLTAFIIAALYFARNVLIPVALAALLTFLLAPLVTRLQRWLGRIGAVLLVVALILGAAGTVGYLLTSQMV